MGSSRRRLLNQSTHSSVAYSTASRLRHGPHRQITSALYGPLIDSAIALSYESLVAPTDASMPHSASPAVPERQVLGDFQRWSQHLDKGGVIWVDHRGGLQNGQDGRQSGRQAGRVSTIEKRSRRSGFTLLQEHRVKRPRWRAVCRNHWVRAGSARPAGWCQSVWSGPRADTCRLLSGKTSHY